MTDREQFEAWARENGLIYESHGLLSVSSSLEMFWKTWQAARAQSSTPNPVEVGTTVQAGQVLTDEDFQNEACKLVLNEPRFVQLRNKIPVGEELNPFAVAFGRAIVEAAVLAKRVPMTDEQARLIAIGDGWYDTDPEFRAFIDGIRAAERHHGIVGEKGGA